MQQNQRDPLDEASANDFLESSQELAQGTETEPVYNEADETAENRLEAETDEAQFEANEDQPFEVEDVKLSRELLGEEEEIEAAEEVAEPIRPRSIDQGDTEERISQADPGRGIGIAGLIFSIVSLFLVPLLLGSVGIVLGVISAARGSRVGWWAAGIGILSIIMSMFVYQRMY